VKLYDFMILNLLFVLVSMYVKSIIKNKKNLE